MQSSKSPSDAMRRFVQDHVQLIEPLTRQAAIAHWQLQLSSTLENNRASSYASARLRNVYADADKWSVLQNIDGSNLEDPLLRRQHDLLSSMFRINQLNPGEIQEIEELRASLSAQYNLHRAHIDGKEYSDNQLDTILANSDDGSLRQQAWEASKTVGAVAVESLLKLVRLRNKTAQKLGYKDYYDMSLDAQEIEPDELGSLLKQLEDGCRPLWHIFRARLDTQLGQQFGVDSSKLMPWHHSNRFFQTMRSEGIDLDHVYAKTDAVQTTRAVFNEIGLPVDDLIDRADLYEKPGKCQHAFCLNVDRKGDIRVLCNITPGERWLTTTLHEFGHAAYYKYIDPSLPYLLRRPSHTMTTEAVALFMGRLPSTANFMQQFSQCSPEECLANSQKAARGQLTHQLVFMHWCLVMAHFEKALYANPEQDLNTLWWDMVEHYQLVKRPDGRNEPDWAAKIHLASSPAYYHNYLLGDMAASQITRAATNHIGTAPGKIDLSPALGAFLNQNVFKSGASHRWDEWIRVATGRPLEAQSFVDDLYGVEAAL